MLKNLKWTSLHFSLTSEFIMFHWTKPHPWEETSVHLWQALRESRQGTWGSLKGVKGTRPGNRPCWKRFTASALREVGGTRTFVVQSLSRVWLFATPWTAGRQASLSFAISWSLFRLMSIELVMPSNHLILCCSLLLLPSVFPSIRVFSNELTLCTRWPEYWSFTLSITPSNEYSGLISFRIDWFDFLAVQRTLKNFL